MTIETRQINIDENKKLSKEISSVSKDINAPLKWSWIIVCFVLIILSAIHILYFYQSNWSIVSKFLFCICPICIWVIVEIKYKGRKKKKKYLGELELISHKGIIEILKIQAKRAIVFKEKDDEGTLYLIEDTNGTSIYLWDDQWLIPGKLKFPKHSIEIYLNPSFIWALSKKVFCYGDAIETLNIPGKIKWSYFKDGFPADMEKPNKLFDEIMLELKNIA